nr:hypothetical protein BaRGS_003752 [Batillaria attramentaria]
MRRHKLARSYNIHIHIILKAPQLEIIRWHLHPSVNHQEFGMDINVTGVWESGITGKGVTVAVVDDGLEWDNPDLHSNYNVEGSWDLNDNDPDPMPNAAKAGGLMMMERQLMDLISWLLGNGGSQQDNCNYDGYANSIYTVTIGAVDESGAMPYYAEECASMLGVTFSSGIASKRDIVTTDWRHKGGTGCTDKHTGTSAAAPLAAGMIGLMLAARPCLTWRDVQYIIIMTAVKVDVDLAHWQINGAGLEHSHKHGFGLIKAWRMVNAARVWHPVSWMSSYSQEDTTGWNIPLTSQDIAGYSLYMLEYVQVTLTLTHPVRGKLAIHLQCPSGTVSVIGAPRPNDKEVEAAMSGQYLSANYTPPCDPPPVTTPPFIPLSEKTLKILFLASAFCVVFAIYETFEYMLCYGEEKRQQQAEMSSHAQRSASSSYGVGSFSIPLYFRLLNFKLEAIWLYVFRVGIK